MKKFLLVLLPLLLLGCASNAKAEKSSKSQSNYNHFWELWNNDKAEEAEAFLEQWQLEDEKDPELYVCYFNMYIDKASFEQMHVESFLPDGYQGKYFTAKNDEGDSIYIYSVIEYDDENSQLAFDYLNKGISYNPKRLDLYFGKAQFYFMRGEYDKQAEVIKTTFELNKKYADSWLWSFNESAKEKRIGFPESIHEYFVKWYNTGDPAAYPYMMEITKLYTKEYPKDVIAYNDAGISALLLNDLVAARTYFERGYELDPSDMILLSNIARINYNLGDTAAAKKYYEIMAASDDPEYSNYAKDILKEYFQQT